MFDHQRGDRRDLDQLMAQRLGILTLQQGAAATAGVRVVLDHLVNALHRQQVRPRAGMPLLPTPLAPTGFTAGRRLKPRAVTGGRL
jgi:hypothetical protein